MKRTSLRVTLLAMLVVATPALPAWQSQLYPLAADGHYAAVPLRYQTRTWALPDFSYSGFWLGARAPGSGVPCGRVRTVATTGDFATALQAAIDDVGSTGGTVVIPAGTFTLKRSISVPYSRVAIVGAGSSHTVINVPSTYTPADESREGVISLGVRAGDSAGAWIDGGEVLTRISRAVDEGERVVIVADPGAVRAGQWIVIQQYYWGGLVRRSDDSGTWGSYASSSFPPPGAPDPHWSFAYLRQVTGISGARLTLDAPIPFALDPLNNPVGIRSADRDSSGRAIGPRDTLGVAGFSLRFADNRTGAQGFPAGTGIYFGGVRNGWAYDIQVSNFPRYGLVIDHSARVTVDSSAAIRAQNSSGGGRGYGFWVVDSQNVLVRRSYAELTRHGYTNAYGLTSMVVYSRNESAGARTNGDDQHFGLAHQLLWDAHTMSYGTGLLLGYRGASSSNAQESNLSSVVWNAADDGYRGTRNGGLLSLAPAADGYSIMVGGPTGHPVYDDGVSPATGPQMPAYPGVQTGPPAERRAPGSRNRNVLYEGLYQTGLTPASLWEQQSIERLGRVPEAYAADACVMPAVAGTIPRSTWQGGGALVFNGDQLGHAVDFGAGCPGDMESGLVSTDAATCKISAREHNATAGGSYSLVILPTARTGAVIANLSGPLRPLQAYGKLMLKVFPSVAGFSFDLAFRRRGEGPDSRDVTIATVTLGPFPANQWSSASVPLGSLPVDRFDTVTLISRGSASASQAWLDDLVLR